MTRPWLPLLAALAACSSTPSETGMEPPCPEPAAGAVAPPAADPAAVNGSSDLAVGWRDGAATRLTVTLTATGVWALRGDRLGDGSGDCSWGYSPEYTLGVHTEDGDLDGTTTWSNELAFVTGDDPLPARPWRIGDSFPTDALPRSVRREVEALHPDLRFRHLWLDATWGIDALPDAVLRAYFDAPDSGEDIVVTEVLLSGSAVDR